MSEPPRNDVTPHDPSSPAVSGRTLSRTLKTRHLSMIALGGVIGAGLLVASSGAILSAGPAVIISYALAGLLVVLIMRMLGEMASASPETGSFSAYAHRFIGPWAGLSIGWLYWWVWVVIVGIEATAAAKIITAWVPGMPQWVPALAFTVLFLVTNLISVKSFGEFEFWFASLKIAAIVAFLVLGALLLLGIVPSSREHFSPFSDHGGFMPHGIGGVLLAMVPVVLSMFGAEVATIAAGESRHPQESVRRAVNSVVWRILVFYIGSMVVILLLLPYDKVESGYSPYTAALAQAGIPWASLAMDVVVLVAVLSTLNAALYTASRMVYSLAERGTAPMALGRVSRNNTPYWAIIASAVVGLACVVLNYAAPDAVFAFLVNSTGATAIFVWLVIAVSQLRSRKSLPAPREGDGVIRMWGFPVLTWAVIVVLVGLLVFMAVSPEPQTRIEFAMSALVAVVSVVAGVVVQKKQGFTADARTTK